MAREPHLIFLSHSGQDKPFVRRLHRALRKAGHDPFFDEYSIPPGEIFPPHILQNATECKLGVVVLSPSFLTSKWPMTELHIMHTSPFNPTLLPLFLSVGPDDLKSSSCSFSTWKNAWEAMAKKDPARISVTEWEAAAHQLPKIQGEINKKYMDEDHFIEAVLCRIGAIIRPLLRYDVSHLTGHERLTEVVAGLFEKMPTGSHLGARAIGFHAIGGQGKTIVCKLMVNHYASAYAGRCTLIEFPSNNCDEKEVVTQCNNALQQLTNLGQSNFIDAPINDFDECLQRMKEHVPGRNVFVAIDNVWEVCLEFAQRILDVGFSRGSIILVTSRSGQVLLNLLKDKSCVKPLPGLSGDEAHQMFAKSFNRNQASHHVKLDNADVHNVTKSFLFHGAYHPLTISAVGVNLGRMGGHDWLAAWKLKRDYFTGSGSVTDKAIKTNFDSIPESRRGMFLDVALIYIPDIQEQSHKRFMYDMRSHQHGFSDLLLAWLSALYMGEMDKTEISMTLMQLAYDGLLEFDNMEVHVHDLYRGLATREAAGSRRFMLSDNRTLEGINRAEVERIVYPGVFPAYNIKEQNFPKLQVLVVPSCNEWGLIHMPQLRVLKLSIKNCRSKEWLGWRDMHELSWLDLKLKRGFVDFHTFRISEDISWLRNLCVLQMEGASFWNLFGMSDDRDESIGDSERLCLDGLVHLQFLFIGYVDQLYEISGLGSLINLKRMVLVYLPCLLKVGNFNCCSAQLQLLSIESCNKLREVAGLGSVPNLKILRLTKRWNSQLVLPSNYDSLWRLALSDGLPRLETLEIEGSDYKVLDFSGLRHCVNLKELTVRRCDALEEIDLSSLNDLPNLTHLHISSCKKLEHIRGEPNGMNHTLRSLTIYGCYELKEIGGLHFLTKCNKRVSSEVEEGFLTS